MVVGVVVGGGVVDTTGGVEGDGVVESKTERKDGQKSINKI